MADSSRDVLLADSGYVYDECIRVLSHIKLTQGPLCVASTLKKRPKLADFLLGHQVNFLDELEEDISALTVHSACDKLNSESN